MPFDPVPVEQASPPAIVALVRAIQFLTPRENWCRGVAQHPDGRRCIGGAITGGFRCAGAELNPAFDAVNRVVLRRYAKRLGNFSDFHAFVAFNDHDDTTHAEVLAVLHEALKEVSDAV